MLMNIDECVTSQAQDLNVASTVGTWIQKNASVDELLSEKSDRSFYLRDQIAVEEIADEVGWLHLVCYLV